MITITLLESHLCLSFIISPVLSNMVYIIHFPINSLPYDKILNQSKSKAFADDKLNGKPLQKLFLGWVENIVGKGENASYQHFLLFPQCFQKAFFFRDI